MAQYNFEGTIDNITERQLEFINKVIGEFGFENSKVLFENVGIPGDNYVASVKRITVEAEGQRFSIIAKIAPANEVLRQIMNVEMLFVNECTMYTVILPKLVQFQKEEGIPEGEQLKYAKCYGTLTDPPNEVILLEDLKSSNYTMLDRFLPLSDECVRSVLKNIATLHSLSYVLKQKEPETFANYKESLIDMWSIMAEVEQMKLFFQDLENDTINILKNPEHTKLIKHKVANTSNQLASLSKVDKDSEIAIIQQGDAWTNNIMFRFEEEKLLNSIMIDYQASKLSNPVTDIMYMIFNCTDHESRSQSFYDWIDYYHTELEKSLSKYDMKIDNIYPRDKLEDDLKRYGQTMFGFSVFFASLHIRKSDDAAKVMETIKNLDGMAMTEQSELMNISLLDEESINRYRNRIVGLIESFTMFGLL